MKRTAEDTNRPAIHGQAYFGNQPPNNLANTAQPNGGHAAGPALVRTIPPIMVPVLPPAPAVLPPFQLARPPQFTQGGPGIAPSMPMNLAPPPVANGGMPLPAVAMPPPSVPDAGAQARSIFEDKALMARVEAAVSKGISSWYSAFFALQGEERIRFGIATIAHLATRSEPLLHPWRGALNACCRQVGMERLLAQQCTDKVSYLFVLIKLGLNELLAEALKIEAGKPWLRTVSQHGNSPLHAAAAYSNFEAAQLILSADDAHGSLRMKENRRGALPIHWAAAFGANDIAGLLLARKGKEQRLKAEPGTGALPVHAAIINAVNAALVKTLIEECAEEQVTARFGSSKRIALMAAIRICSPEIVRLLLDVRSALPQQLTMRNNENRTALDYAKECGTSEILALIEAAMKDLPEASSSSTTSTGATTSNSATTTTASAPSPGAEDGPVPLTPFPATPMADAWPEVEEEFEAPDF